MRDLLKALLIGTVAADENKGKLKKISFLFDIYRYVQKRFWLTLNILITCKGDIKPVTFNSNGKPVIAGALVRGFMGPSSQFTDMYCKWSNNFVVRKLKNHSSHILIPNEFNYSRVVFDHSYRASKGLRERRSLLAGTNPKICWMAKIISQKSRMRSKKGMV